MRPWGHNHGLGEWKSPTAWATSRGDGNQAGTAPDAASGLGESPQWDSGPEELGGLGDSPREGSLPLACRIVPFLFVFSGLLLEMWQPTLHVVLKGKQRCGLWGPGPG